MATSSSTEQLPEPRVVELDTIAAQAVAIDELIALARHRIQVFDQDLSQTGWSSSARADRLAAFLRGIRGRRLDIIVHDTRFLERACPRMLDLLRNYGHAMTVYQTGAEAKIATDPLLIVDGVHYLHRFHFERPRAAFGVSQPEQTKPLASRFEEIWATGEPGVTGTVLGL